MVDVDNKEKVDYLFKFIIIGDTGVGKSCILNQYLRGKCKSLYLLVIILIISVTILDTHT